MDPVEEIKSKIDIVDLIQEYVPLRRAGRNFKALCPFHSEKTPSFMVSPELQIFKCFGCGEGGDVFAFLEKFEGIEFPEALRILAKRTGVKLRPFAGQPGFAQTERLYQINHLAAEFYHFLLTGHPVGRGAASYLTKTRKLIPEALTVFKIGFAPDKPDALILFLTKKKDYKISELDKAGLTVSVEGKTFDRFQGRVVFPLRDHRGNTVGFSGRILPSDEGKDLAKYINSPETPIYQKRRHLFGLDVTREDVKKKSSVVVVEGELDLISSWQKGIKNIVAIKGSALTAEHTKLLSRFAQELVLALDTDLAEDFAARRGIEIAQEEGLSVKVAAISGAKDPDELARADPQALKRAIERAIPVYDFLIEGVLRRFSPATGEGKAKISQKLAPILAGITDKIVQSHYVTVLADRLGIAEEAVAAQVASKALPPREIKEELAVPAQKSRRELLEENLMSIVLQGEPKSLANEEFTLLIKNPTLLRIREEAVRFLQKRKNFDPSRFAAGLPKELVEPFATLTLADVGDFLEDSRKFTREVENTKREIKIIDLRDRLVKLTQTIKKLEEKPGAGLEAAKGEFVKISAKLSSLKQG